MVEAQIPLTSPLPEHIQALGSCQKDLSPNTHSILGTAAQTLTTHLLERSISECGLDLRTIYNTDTDSFGPNYLGRISPTAQEVLRGMVEAQIPLTSPLPEPI